jgi:hypothetical protein
MTSPGSLVPPASRRSRWWRASLVARSALVVGAALMAPHRFEAQEPRPPIRTLMGDVALILHPRGDGTMLIGIAGPRRTLTLNARATDARRWADSAARLVARAPRRAPAPRPKGKGKGGAPAASDTVQRARAVLEEPGAGTGSLVLSRVDSGATRQFLLFVDDAELEAIRQPLDADEAATLVRLVRRAAGPPSTARRARR